MKRFAALVAALVICSSLCVPAFASNNASTQKWVIVDSSQMRAENGELSTYFKLSPYSNGALYATPITTQYAYAFRNLGSTTRNDVWAFPTNYPDWWRSSLPLGNNTYVEFSSVRVVTNSYDGYSPDELQFVPIHRNSLLNFTASFYSSATSFSGSLAGVPVLFHNYTESSPWVFSLNSSGFVFSASDVTSSDFYVRGLLGSKPNLVYSPTGLAESYSGVVSNVPFTFQQVLPFANASSSDIIWTVGPSVFNMSDNPSSLSTVSVTAVVSYWIDANKLPAGLQVGDEFPANNDAFDQLRDDLIEQFPEAADNIQNGKSTIQGWNDTETVDTDVASTSISVLNALFQNLGGFLFIISLMVFGAVVLRMLIRTDDFS